MLVEGGERRAVVLGVASLEKARAILPLVLLPPDDKDVAWLDPSAPSCLAIGLAEVHEPVPRSAGLAGER
jgi:hypothetical protein